jgi:hypothetical protein
MALCVVPNTLNNEIKVPKSQINATSKTINEPYVKVEPFWRIIEQKKKINGLAMPSGFHQEFPPPL